MSEYIHSDDDAEFEKCLAEGPIGFRSIFI